MKLSDLDPHYDAAIIGLGPVGAAAANLLGREGLRTLAVDLAPAPFMLPRAIVLDDMSLRLLQPLGIPDAIAKSIGVYRTSEYRAASGDVLRRIVQPKEPYLHSWTPYATFVQPDLEGALRDALTSCAAIDVALGVRARLADQGEGGARILLDDLTTGESREISCEYLLGCDGASSPLREALGITLEDLCFDEPWLVVDALVNDLSSLPEVNIQNCDPARPSTYVRGPGMLRRWEFMLLPGEDPEEVARHDNIWRLLEGQLTPDQGRIWRAATYRFHALVANQWRQGNIFLLGDAAHQTPPFMGQGLNQGLRDAGNLCWKIGAVFHGRASSSIFDSYQTERRPMTKDVIETSKQLGRVICELDEAAAADRNQRMLADMRNGLGEVVRQDLIPSILTAGFILESEEGAPVAGAGRMFPQPWVVKDGARRRLDDILPPGFLLVARPGWVPDEAIRQTADRLCIWIATLGDAGPGVMAIAEEDGIIMRWMDDLGVDAVLVRPDRFVFGAAQGADPEAALIAGLVRALSAHH